MWRVGAILVQLPRSISPFPGQIAIPGGAGGDPGGSPCSISPFPGQIAVKHTLTYSASCGETTQVTMAAPGGAGGACVYSVCVPVCVCQCVCV